MSDNDQRLSLGIDTGGTYTDAVLYNSASGIVAKAKALTTRQDLSIGIAGAIDAVLAASGRLPGSIDLVSLSTTLATNALVENQGGRVALVMIGFERAEFERDGLASALADGPVVFLPGGHTVHGHEKPLQIDELDAVLEDWAASVDAVAVAGYFAVRNPAHETAVRDRIRIRTGLPVTCSHELSAALGGPRRALTTVINARLIALIERLMDATQSLLDDRGIAAPLMIVRGDGALMSAAQARLRPIETILSGPAASVVGARHLTGRPMALVADIGGTTTDIAVIEEGQPALNGDGATVGGMRTMIEAIAMHTYGLGGDSEIAVETASLTSSLRLGPRRLMPLSLAAHHHEQSVLEALERQARSDPPGRLDGRFAVALVSGSRPIAGISPADARLLARMTDIPLPLDRLIQSAAERAALDRLVARGLCAIAGFTPTDAMHVLGRQALWSRNAAILGAGLFARRKTGRGAPVASSAEALCEEVARLFIRQSAMMVLDAALKAEGSENALDNAAMDFAKIDPFSSPSIARALTGRNGIVGMNLSLDRPVIAVGASAPIYYPAICDALGAELVLSKDGDVANALGAVVGQVREIALIVVTSPDGERFSLSGAGAAGSFDEETAALAAATQQARARALLRAKEAGAGNDVDVSLTTTIIAPEKHGVRTFVEATVRAIATGRPRLGRT